MADAEIIRLRALELEKLTDDYVAGRLADVKDLPSLLFAIRKVDGVTFDEAEIYLNRVKTLSKGQPPPSPQLVRETTPDNLAPEDVGPWRDARDTRHKLAVDKQTLEQKRVTEEAQWAGLARRLQQGPRLLDFEDSYKDLLDSMDNGTHIPSSLTSVMPHLLEMENAVISDDIISKTWEIRRAFAKESSSVEAVINLLQQQTLEEPLPRSLWKDIIFDRFIRLDKLHATLQPGFDHRDEPKHLTADLSIVKKDVITARKAVTTHSEWSVCFRALRDATILVYPHRSIELTSYEKIINRAFRDFPNSPQVAIKLDEAAREKYSRLPFRMDDDSVIAVLAVSQMLRSSSVGSSNSAKRKEPPFSSEPHPPRKKLAPVNSVVCLNWNQNRCPDPCEFSRRHGICCQCGDPHRADDFESCKAGLTARFLELRARQRT